MVHRGRTTGNIAHTIRVPKKMSPADIPLFAIHLTFTRCCPSTAIAPPILNSIVKMGGHAIGKETRSEMVWTYVIPIDLAPSEPSRFPASEMVMRMKTKSPRRPKKIPPMAIMELTVGNGHCSHLSARPECEKPSAHAAQRNDPFL